MSKEKQIDKIKKLLNKARNNSSAKEAAAALRMARKMMQEIGLQENEIELLDITLSDSQSSPSHAHKAPHYVAILMSAVSRAFGVKALTVWKRFDDGSSKRSVQFYGPRERPEIAAYAFDVLVRQITKARKEFLAGLHKNIKTANKTARADAFCEYWVMGVYSNLEEFACTPKEEALIAEYEQRYFEHAKAFSGRKAKEVRGVDEARCKGFGAGRRVKLNHAVTGKASTSHQLEAR
ncbi:Protein of uncharacterised function (DUF2786) [Shigella sonnei]|uniref:DUF2786 domain-containing protein n=1 Tax=Shigella sonnei TaxID=624 RepID=UPI000972ED04|nr:DUF2786 domain-containing protein [Shigella sonnei]SJI66902.1 Protein of uncharacterised function (DUF2786) [Shigella sonnei]